MKRDGTLTGKRLLFDFGPHRRGIDGMTLDVRGNIYATAGRGDESGIYVFDPTGKPLAFVATPAAPTNCVFGTAAESRTLYITAPGPTRDGKPARDALYRVKLKVADYRLFPVEKK